MESNLSLQYSDLTAEVGYFLGYGRGTGSDPAWDSTQSANIASCVKSGLRQVNMPPPLEGESGSYDWSWLKPVGNFSLASGASTILLPDDFGNFEGRLSISSPAGNCFWPVELVGVGEVYEQQNRLPTTTGRPLIACVEPLKGTTGSQGQRFQMRVFPKSDQAYTFQGQYYFLADNINGTNPYPYGGMAHAELYREACLKAAEQFLDDARAIHSALFQERLAASISFDRRSKPQKLGYNADRSDTRWRGWGPEDRHGLASVTYNGVQY